MTGNNFKVIGWIQAKLNGKFTNDYTIVYPTKRCAMLDKHFADVRIIKVKITPITPSRKK